MHIHFEEAKGYALFTDLANGMASEYKFRAKVNGELFLIPANRYRNDYLELQILKEKLYLKVRPI